MTITCHIIYIVHTQMHKVSKIKMDQCAKTVVNEDGRKTAGDILCEKINFFYDRGDFGDAPKPDKIDNIEIIFRYSACESDWEAIVGGGKPLVGPEHLCCERSGDNFKFRRCDGSSFISVC